MDFNLVKRTLQPTRRVIDETGGGNVHKSVLLRPLYIDEEANPEMCMCHRLHPTEKEHVKMRESSMPVPIKHLKSLYHPVFMAVGDILVIRSYGKFMGVCEMSKIEEVEIGRGLYKEIYLSRVGNTDEVIGKTYVRDGSQSHYNGIGVLQTSNPKCVVEGEKTEETYYYLNDITFDSLRLPVTKDMLDLLDR